MTLKERVERMSVAELRAELMKAKVRQQQGKGGVLKAPPSLPRLASERAALMEKQHTIAKHYMRNETCSHHLHRAPWIPGPFQIAHTEWWMVPCVCSECGEMVRKFVEVR